MKEAVTVGADALSNFAGTYITRRSMIRAVVTITSVAQQTSCDAINPDARTSQRLKYDTIGTNVWDIDESARELIGDEPCSVSVMVQQ